MCRMDTILLVLALSKKQLLASELAPIVGRGDQAVRKSLTALSTAGLVTRRQTSTSGPVGTWAWGITPDGLRAIAPLANWLKRQSVTR